RHVPNRNGEPFRIFRTTQPKMNRGIKSRLSMTERQVLICLERQNDLILRKAVNKLLEIILHFSPLSSPQDACAFSTHRGPCSFSSGSSPAKLCPLAIDSICCGWPELPQDVQRPNAAKQSVGVWRSLVSLLAFPSHFLAERVPVVALFHNAHVLLDVFGAGGSKHRLSAEVVGNRVTRLQSDISNNHDTTRARTDEQNVSPKLVKVKIRAIGFKATIKFDAKEVTIMLNFFYFQC